MPSIRVQIQRRRNERKRSPDLRGLSHFKQSGSRMKLKPFNLSAAIGSILKQKKIKIVRTLYKLRNKYKLNASECRSMIYLFFALKNTSRAARPTRIYECVRNAAVMRKLTEKGHFHTREQTTKHGSWLNTERGHSWPCVVKTLRMNREKC